MAKETLQTLDQAELQAKQVIADAKTKAGEMLLEAQVTKRQKLDAFALQSKQDLADNQQLAQVQAERLVSASQATIKQELDTLQTAYLDNKQDAIQAVIDTILA